MNFSHNTESVLQHVDHLRPIEFFFEKMMGKINYFPRGWGGYPFVENSTQKD